MSTLSATFNANIFFFPGKILLQFNHIYIMVDFFVGILCNGEPVCGGHKRVHPGLLPGRARHLPRAGRAQGDDSQVNQLVPLNARGMDTWYYTWYYDYLIRLLTRESLLPPLLLRLIHIKYFDNWFFFHFKKHRFFVARGIEMKRYICVLHAKYTM